LSTRWRETGHVCEQLYINTGSGLSSDL
jgi:hypothetical protein